MRIAVWNVSNTQFVAATALAVSLGALGLAIANGPETSGARQGSVEVSAVGTVTARPDTLTADMSVRTTANTSQAALTKNDREMHSLQADLVGAGIAKKDLQTTNLTVTRNYDSHGNPSGYLAENDLVVTLHKLANAEQLIGQALSVVGNDVSVNSTTYSISKRSRFETEARQNAMRNARNKANGLATGGDAMLGQITKISETEQNTPEPIAANGLAPNSSAKAAAPAIPLQPGTETITVQVDVVYGLLS